MCDSLDKAVFAEMELVMRKIHGFGVQSVGSDTPVKSKVKISSSAETNSLLCTFSFLSFFLSSLLSFPPSFFFFFF